MNTIPLEEDTRALINNALFNLGWHWNGENPNVFFERAKTTEQQKKLGRKRPDYVLYEDKSDKPLIVIEAKRRGGKIDEALQQGIWYAKAINAPLVFATDGVFCKTYHTVDNCTPILNGEELDEFVRETLALKFLNSHEVNTVNPKIQYNRRELIKIFGEANNILRGEGLHAGIERFSEFANILFLKLITEMEEIKRESGLTSKFENICSWQSIKGVPLDARIEYINNTVFKRLNNLYETDIFEPLSIRNGSILSEIMDKLDPLALIDVDSDVKGDAFEYFLRESTSTKNDLGEYFTPRHIVKTMVRLVDPKIGEKIYDPFCGTGGFLIESFRHIYNNMARNEQNLKTLQTATVYGNEITKTARIAKMNMILAGDGHSNIQMKDSLASPIDGMQIIRDKNGNECGNGFDVVITNMPYSQRTKYGSLYDLPSNNGDSICVQHCIKAINSLSDNGRIALVVPEGFLFRKDLAKTREYLLEKCNLQSVISLPQGVFLPYTPVKTDIIYATNVNKRNKAADKNYFWYFDVKSDGYSLDNHRRKLQTGSDLNRYEEYRKLDKDQSESMINVGFEKILLDKVKENSFILSGTRYRNLVTRRKSEYQYLPIKDICIVIAGQSPNGEYYNKNKNGMPFYQGTIDFGEKYINDTDLYTSYVTKEAIPNDILISVRAPVGEINICNNNICIGRGLMALRPNENIDYKYLFYILKYYGGLILKDNSLGSTFESITKEEVENFTVPVPDINEQNKIISEIENWHKIVMHSMEIIKSYKISVNLDNYNVIKIKELFEFISGNLNPEKRKGRVNYIGLENIEQESGRIIGDIVSDFSEIKSTKRTFQKGDILYGKLRPNLNKVAYVDFDGICSTDIFVLRPKIKDIDAEFYSILLRQKEFNDMVLNGVSGGQLPRVSKEYFADLPIPKVPYDKQKEMMIQIKQEQELIESARKTIELFTQKIQNRVNEIWGK